MSQVEAAIVQSFVDGPHGGNPAGVVLDADHLTTRAKQAIAAELALSETAFVSHSDLADFKIEFFTPVKQVPHCGHATVATVAYLVQLGRLAPGRRSNETIDGPRELLIEGDMVFMGQRAPRYAALSEADKDAVLRALGVGASALAPERSPEIVNTGVDFLLIPMRDAATTRRLAPDQTAIQALSEALDLIGFYAFTTETSQTGRDAGARMFAPRYGIAEESATGMAAGPLACWLHDRLGLAQDVFRIEQGWLMAAPSPSLITVRLRREKRRIESLLAGGRAVLQSKRLVAA